MTYFDLDELIACYRSGVFPMAQNRDEQGFYIVDPDWRCILPLDAFTIARRLARTLRQDRFSFSINRDFRAVIDGCAAPGPDREDTWINRDIRALFLAAHAQGLAHSIEAWRNGELAGGLYGIAIGGVFYGESMFSRVTDASKAALVHLVARLRHGGFKLLDVQFVTEHLMQFGAQNLPRAVFQDLLIPALIARGDFHALPEDTRGADLVRIAAAS